MSEIDCGIFSGVAGVEGKFDSTGLVEALAGTGGGAVGGTVGGATGCGCAAAAAAVATFAVSGFCGAMG